MKRLITATIIITIIVTLGVLTIVIIANENQKLYGEINSVINGYLSGENIEDSISSLEKATEKYRKTVGVVSSDETLQQIDEAVTKLKAMYESGSDEFLAECYLVRTIAIEILEQQTPTLSRLL